MTQAVEAWNTVKARGNYVGRAPQQNYRDEVVHEM